MSKTAFCQVWLKLAPLLGSIYEGRKRVKCYTPIVKYKKIQITNFNHFWQQATSAQTITHDEKYGIQRN